MARILNRQEWYFEVSPTSLLEVEYEQLILQHSLQLFPDYIAVPFKSTVESEHGRAKADLALIRCDYREWWVVEVEMSRHSLHQHVLPQVQVLSSAFYGSEVVDALCESDSRLDRDKVKAMLKGAQPRVLVIVDAPRESWQVDLAPFQALVMIFQIFRSDRNDHLFRLEGDLPSLDLQALTVCHADSTIPRFLVVESPESIRHLRETSLDILFDGRQTRWTQLEAKDRVYLVPEGANPLSVRTKYLLVKGENGELQFQLAR